MSQTLGKITITFEAKSNPIIKIDGHIPPRQIQMLDYNLRREYRIHMHELTRISKKERGERAAEENAKAKMITQVEPAPEPLATEVVVKPFKAEPVKVKKQAKAVAKPSIKETKDETDKGTGKVRSNDEGRGSSESTKG